MTVCFNKLLRADLAFKLIPNKLKVTPDANFSTLILNSKTASKTPLLKPSKWFKHDNSTETCTKTAMTVTGRHFSTTKIEIDNVPKSLAYSQALLSKDFLFISGILPLDPKTGKLVDDNISVQTGCVLNYIESLLHEANLTFADVVRAEVFLKDLKDFKDMNDIYLTRFTGPVKPVRQTIGGIQLVQNAKVEISVIARKSKEEFPNKDISYSPNGC